MFPLLEFLIFTYTCYTSITKCDRISSNFMNLEDHNLVFKKDTNLHPLTYVGTAHY